MNFAVDRILWATSILAIFLLCAAVITVPLRALGIPVEGNPYMDLLLLPVVPVALLGYFVGLEYWFGKTVGKMLTRTRLVMRDGSRPRLGAVVIRTLCRLIPFEPLSIVFGSWWHDSISGTMVIDD